MRRLLARPADVLHLQWLAAPELDVFLLRASRPLVFTAHDLVPRRTAGRRRLWGRLFGRFDRIVVHSERGRDALAGLGVEVAKLRVVPHPVFRSDPPRADDGRTVLAPGVIRPYKGLPDAVRATLAVPGARLLVAGDPRIPLDELRQTAGDRAEWRLGYLGAPDLERALSEATVAVFPYRAELDQSGALLQALGAGVPAVVYDVGGLGEVVARFAAGRVVAPGDVDGLRAALRELLDDPDTLAAAREGAKRARDELTWDAAASAHLSLYEELT
jgi:glycosyltransferase involved in cell wall biosynthesis